MKTRFRLITVIAMVLILAFPVTASAGQTSTTGYTQGGIIIHTQATLNAGPTYGAGTTSVTTSWVLPTEYQLSTTVTIHYKNHLGQSAATSGWGSSSAGASISSGTVTSATSEHDVGSYSYGSWHATLSVLP